MFLTIKLEMAENPGNIIRSWNQQQNFATGAVVQNKLLPPKFRRTRHNFVMTWREEVCSSSLDWGVSNFSVKLDKSLQVLGSVWLKVQLPANSAATAFKKYPGNYVIRSLRILSGGRELYTCDHGMFLADYMGSLNEEQLATFVSGARP